MKVVSLVVCVGSVLLLLATGSAQSSQAPFAMTITAPQVRVKRGTEVTVDLTLVNTSKRDITIEFTSLLSDYAVEVRDSTGKSAPDTEFKRGMEAAGSIKVTGGRDSFVKLKPNESRKDEIAVSRLSDMSQPGEYSVQVMRKVPKEFGDIVVKSNTVKITVTP